MSSSGVGNAEADSAVKERERERGAKMIGAYHRLLLSEGGGGSERRGGGRKGVYVRRRGVCA